MLTNGAQGNSCNPVSKRIPPALPVNYIFSLSIWATFCGQMFSLEFLLLFLFYCFVLAVLFIAFNLNYVTHFYKPMVGILYWIQVKNYLSKSKKTADGKAWTEKRIG